MVCYLSGLAQGLIPLVFLECELFCRLLSLYDIFLLPRDPFLYLFYFLFCYMIIVKRRRWRRRRCFFFCHYYSFFLLGVSCCTILSASQRIKRAKQIHEMASDWGYCLSMRILASASGSICLSPARSITTLSIIPPVNWEPALYSSLTGEAESRPISKPSSSE